MPIPVPPPPEGVPDLIESLPVETKAIAGEPDLMHHKYAIRDGEAVFTGSSNWTCDSWTRQENVLATVESPELARHFELNFQQLWETGSVELSGDIDPDPVDVAGSRVRAWFCPGRGESLAHRIANRVSRARERIRICSPVLTSAPVLGSLAEAIASRKGRRGRLCRRDPDARRLLPVAARTATRPGRCRSSRRSGGAPPSPASARRRTAAETTSTTSCTRRSRCATRRSSSEATTSRTRARRMRRTCSRSETASSPTGWPRSSTRYGRLYPEAPLPGDEEAERRAAAH